MQLNMTAASIALLTLSFFLVICGLIYAASNEYGQRTLEKKYAAVCTHRLFITFAYMAAVTAYFFLLKK
jgi:hypothetical protein